MKTTQEEGLASLPRSRVASSFFCSPAGRERNELNNQSSTVINSLSIVKKLAKTKTSSMSLTERVVRRKTGMDHSMNLHALKEADP